jgi:hypothetical protein
MVINRMQVQMIIDLKLWGSDFFAKKLEIPSSASEMQRCLIRVKNSDNFKF